METKEKRKVKNFASLALSFILSHPLPGTRRRKRDALNPETLYFKRLAALGTKRLPREPRPAPEAQPRSVAAPKKHKDALAERARPQSIVGPGLGAAERGRECPGRVRGDHGRRTRDGEGRRREKSAGEREAGEGGRERGSCD